MIQGLSWLLLFQLAGELLVLLLDWPVPGPVAGMALLFLALLWRGGPGRRLAQASSQLLLHLSLLFVPAGAGVVLYGALLVAAVGGAGGQHAAGDGRGGAAATRPVAPFPPRPGAALRCSSVPPWSGSAWPARRCCG